MWTAGETVIKKDTSATRWARKGQTCLCTCTPQQPFSDPEMFKVLSSLFDSPLHSKLNSLSSCTVLQVSYPWLTSHLFPFPTPPRPSDCLGSFTIIFAQRFFVLKSLLVLTLLSHTRVTQLCCKALQAEKKENIQFCVKCFGMQTSGLVGISSLDWNNPYMRVRFYWNNPSIRVRFDWNNPSRRVRCHTK